MVRHYVKEYLFFVMNAVWESLIGFPCDGKRPTIKRWGEIESRLPPRTGINYGVLTGRRPNNLTVLDLDVVKPHENPDEYLCGVEAYRLLLARCGISEIATPVVRTRSGGLHVYFRYSEALGAGGVKKLQCERFGVHLCREQQIRCCKCDPPWCKGLTMRLACNRSRVRISRR